ncbi:hypothetical protein DICVIV_11084 [Dictyocaulus viviparus]|uniref:Uncharacterized protein n=1 Tax=Dictyocaulus viviparus TaxID=29172 RepID=A0A0D8XGP5_DICVI|nr:hypothetical protein DICVIV_11084 [Dictyocaulus viviparus]
MAMRHQSDEVDETTPSPGEKMVDRLAVNLAGALVKSMFPEIDRTEKVQEIRRAPVSPFQSSNGNYLLQQGGPDYGTLSQITQQNPTNQFINNAQLPASYSPYLQQSSGLNPNIGEGMVNNMGIPQTALMMPNSPLMFSGGNGSPESLNALRNQQYLAQLARHQSELNQYSSKQMEYLDQQRRYQQSMIDHQAGAALLMQKQQQELISEQMKKLRESYGNGNHLGNDSIIGGRIRSARAKGVKTHSHGTPKRQFTDDDVITNDAHLREYFKEKYGIDISSEDSTLTDEERETLRALKKLLSKNKEETIERGVFRTMDSLKRKMSVRRDQSSRSTAEQEIVRSSKSSSCHQCIAHNIGMMKGGWTQMYGNPNVIKQIYGTIMSLQGAMSVNEKTILTSKKTACVGLEIGPYRNRSAELNMFFRDDSKGNELHEVVFYFIHTLRDIHANVKKNKLFVLQMFGSISSVEGNVIMIDTDRYQVEMCLVKAGPVEADRYEFIVLTETTGKNACRSYHVFARNTDEFNRRHFDYISDFMKSETQLSSVLPVGAFPMASLCQLDRP